MPLLEEGPPTGFLSEPGADLRKALPEGDQRRFQESLVSCPIALLAARQFVVSGNKRIVEFLS